MKKSRIWFLGVFLLLSVFLMGCEGEETSEMNQIYYLNMEVTKIVPEDYGIISTESQEMVEELLGQLSQEPENGELRQAIPGGVAVQNFELKGYLLTVDFNDAYYNMTATEEVLSRAAVVRTLLQVDGISYVSFTVNGVPITDSNGKLVGSMNYESFVENPGEQINASNSTSLTLYFATGDGVALEKETRVVHYSSNISLEKLVMEQILEGPRTSGLQAAVPTDTRLITISVVEGVCYVNLDETFRNQNDEITEQVVLYSIVNSLTELPNVSKVQLSVNGDTSGKVRYTYDLSTMYEADLSYLEEEEPDDGGSDDEEPNDSTENIQDPEVPLGPDGTEILELLIP